MAIYSVWNIGTGQFDYYETDQQPRRTNAGKPGHLRSRTLGMTVEQAAWPLPLGAVRTGSGPHAQGKVAIHPSEALGAASGGGMTAVKAFLLATAGAMGWKYLVGRRGRR